MNNPNRTRNRHQLALLISFILVTMLALTGCQPAAPAIQTTPTVEIPVTGSTPTQAAGQIPSITVQDQTVEAGSVTIERVVSDGPGWMVIHADANGGPGPVIGFTPVQEGENSFIQVEINESQATETLHAMLHTDASVVGTYEFPGADVPVQHEGQMVTQAFMVHGELDGEVEIVPMVRVRDQGISKGTVTISEIISEGPGWIVIHSQQEGKPGTVVGFAEVQAGKNENIIVEVDESRTTETLYAMLHSDVGEVGVYEFPGPDGPVMHAGQVVTPSFKKLEEKVQTREPAYLPGRDDTGYGDEYGYEEVTPSQPASQNAGIRVTEDPALGKFLVDEEGMTLYLFTRDELDVSNCSGGCLEAWPPLLSEGEPAAGEGVDQSLLGVITREDGSQQVTYRGMPLYTYVQDRQPGDTTGQGVGGVWFIVEP